MNTRGKKNERGATMVDYALLIAMIALCIGGVLALKAGVGAVFAQQGCNEARGLYCDD